MNKDHTARRVWSLFTAMLEQQKRDLDREARRVGLTQVSAYALYALSELPPGPIGQLASKLDVDPGWATIIIDKLERRGAVRRRASDTDRRVRVIELTAAGIRIVSQLRDIVLAPGPLGALSERDLQSLVEIAERAAALNVAREPMGNRAEQPVSVVVSGGRVRRLRARQKAHAADDVTRSRRQFRPKASSAASAAGRGRRPARG